MEPSFEKLTDLLEKQLRIYQELLELAASKKNHLVKGAMEELEALTKREEALIFQAGSLEKEREYCAAGLISAFNLQENATLEEIAGQGPPEAKVRLDQISRELREIFSKLSRHNKENTALIKQSLQFISFTLESLTSSGPATYSPEQELKQEQLIRLLDKKA